MESLSHIDYRLRRKQFYAEVKNAVAVLPSAEHQVRNPDVTFPFRQESNLYYLTGFEEPHCVALFAPHSKTPFQFFVQPRNKTKELWEGKIWGPEAAKSRFGADAAASSATEIPFDEAFVTAICEAERLYYRVGLDREWDSRIFRLLEVAKKRLGRTGRSLWPIFDPNEVLGEQRLVKTRAELERLEKACEITADAHASAMRLVKPDMYEYEVEALLFHAFRIQGAERLGYGSIVAGGSNACCLHYVANNKRLNEKDLLLIDAGAELDYFTSDITRVFPVGQVFSKEQREIYSAVLTAQKSCIKMARPGKTMRDLHDHATEVLVDELKKLKILKGPTPQIIKKLEHKRYYPHGTGHWLGMDVHDVGRYYAQRLQDPRKLAPGMVFTIEPGLYFGADSDAPAKYKGIGVRIEDDIVITNQGCRVLTSGVPKEIEEIESLRSA
ncbi:MAG: aminopeptidase P family protein [Deltaproteobacteria bacterium]|nr:aminopeptidase P family protein [Deltaproteobacteria bacterium]MBI3293274.1 aminopeptidase P family protein [Deltaproteobacteria bacterium]